MKDIVELLEISLKTVPEEYFRKRYKMDESIYLYFDKPRHRIDRKDMVFIDKKTNKQIAMELEHSKIYSTKAETVEKFEEHNRLQKELVIKFCREHLKRVEQ